MKKKVARNFNKNKKKYVKVWKVEREEEELYNFVYFQEKKLRVLMTQ